MVKTRHTQRVDTETVPPSDEHWSLDSRATKRSRIINVEEDEDSDDSGVVKFKGIPQDVHDDGGHSLRSSRSTAKRVTYVEDYLVDSDSDIEDRLRQRRRRGAHVAFKDRKSKVNGISDDDDEEEEKPVSPRGRRKLSDSPEKSPPRYRRNSGPSVERGLERRRLRRTAEFGAGKQSSKQIKREQLSEIEESGIRRSSRARRCTYGTYNQKILEQAYETDERPIKRRRHTEVDIIENFQDKNDDEFTDIYSRVKRQRKVVKRDMYGMPIETDNEDAEEGDDDDNEDNEDGSSNDDDDEEDDDDNENDDDNDDDDGSSSKKLERRSYNLRENKPRTQLYHAPVEERKPRNQNRFFHQDEVSTPHSPARRKRTQKLSYLSPARKRGISNRHKRRAFHGSSSTSSSSSDSSDEERFQRRKAKSMMKARQSCLPMNFDPDDITRSTILRDRQKIGSSLADVDPMNIDRSVTFDSVGGLGKHVRALKEMVVFPLLYPEIFERFKIAPPRGCLFYGPPGTGKTLVARALANECSHDDRRVAFYMRKGADCLSKWVGESERQLRLLFDQAYQTRPSIIFFDEIDGLAPVRSSRQDQIHSSIVSTLLALMDGLDSRGEIVVIGATNRLDSIDPALRRPGRFDREFLFPLPSAQARRQILKIHTKEWNPKLCDKFVSEVAEKCVGFCGADLKALCTEAALLALRRRYPQIYNSSEKLQIDVSSISVNAKDFHGAMKAIVPASQRSVSSPARALSNQVAPLLRALFNEILSALDSIYPSVLMQLSNLDSPATDKPAVEGGEEISLEELDTDDEAEVNICEQKVDKRKKQSNIPQVPESFLDFTRYAHRHPSTHRPRMLLSGHTDQGQTSHLGPAVIHRLEQLPVHVLDLSSLYAVNARTPEESCAHVFREAKRTSPSIIYLPRLSQWWCVIGDTVRSTILTLIHDLDPSSPVLLLATCEEKYDDLEFSLQDLFDEYSGEVIIVRNPSMDERKEFFKDLLLNQATRAPPQRRVAAERMLEVLPKAPPPEPRKLTEQEQQKLYEHEEATLTELRLFLRDVLNKLGQDRKFFIFTKPVDIEDVPDYYDIIKKPMDLSTMMSKIDLHHYQTVKEFLDDINQISLNALEYNPDRDPQSRVIRHRACALKDTACSILKAELDPEFEKVCLGIVESRKKRGVEGSKSAPSFYYTRPLNTGPMHPLAITKQSASNSAAVSRDPNVRLSRRLQGAEAVDVPPLEEVEKAARLSRSLLKVQNSPEKQDPKFTTPQDQLKKSSQDTPDSSGAKKSQGCTSSKTKCSAQKASSSSTKKPVKKDIWGSGGYRRRRRKRKRIDTDTEDAEVDSNNEDGAGSDNDENDDENEDMDTDKTCDTSSRAGSRRQSCESNIKTSQAIENSAEVPQVKTSHMENLSVDVHMKSPKDASCKSPSQRSPRSSSQKSPRHQTDDSPVRTRSESCHITRSQRLSTEGRSPRSSDRSNVDNDTGPKSPNSVPKSDEVTNKNISSEQNEGESVHPRTSVNTEKPPMIKALVNEFVDSGVGSSDCSGDSNDSVGKLIKEMAKETKIGSKELEVLQCGQTVDSLEKDRETKDVPSPVFHLTRSRLQTKSQEKAAQVISELREPVVIDRERLVRLLDLTVLLTEDYTVPRLEKLYSLYAQCIYQRRHDYNKTLLLEDMEKRLKHYTSSITQRLRAEKSREMTS